MTKIAMIGGGSVQWAPELTNDIALTETLHGAEFVLHDIDPEALNRMLPLCRKITQQHQSNIQVTAAMDRKEALKAADFVILSVGIGGLAAMQNDLEIPEKYGVYHSVGDTVGPGGISRALRHIPFALQVAREMETLCPDAWLLNLTNPMTTICRAVSKSTRIRTIGLCHEVGGMHTHMAQFFQVPKEEIAFQVAGINHLPTFTQFTIGGKDGYKLLHEWMGKHHPQDLVGKFRISSAINTFVDTLAVKLTLFQQTDVLFAAGDRHVAEFFHGFLTKETKYGKRFGVYRTTIKHRHELLKTRTEQTTYYRPPATISDEELAPLIAALSGGPPGRFTLNIPNQGQIANLQREAVVECTVRVDAKGLHPEDIGPLSPAAHAAIAPHVDRQELVVAAILDENPDLARIALASDPMLKNPSYALPMFEELLEANRLVMAAHEQSKTALDPQQAMDEIAALNAQPVTGGFYDSGKDGFNVNYNTLGELLENDRSRAVLEKHFRSLLKHPQLSQGYHLTLRAIAGYVPFLLTRRKLRKIQEDLDKLNG